jgi:glycyl-tRNA synthetase
VGLADRSAFDLDAHSKATNVDLNAFVKYDKPIEKEVLQVTPVMKELGKAFKKEGAVIKEALLALEDSQKLAMQAAHAEGSAAPLVTCAGTFEITPEQVTIVKKMSKVQGRSFTPGVIEPSFGIGRIIYCMCVNALSFPSNTIPVRLPSLAFLPLRP